MKINSIIHSYDKFELNVQNIEINKGEIVGLVGENGAGKSTLMNLLSGYMTSNKSFDVENLSLNSRLFVPSELDVYDYLTVEEFVFFVKKYSNTNMSIEEIIKILDLEEKSNVLIEDLSQGMKKKLTLISLFIKEYDFIILDEPFNSIDLNYIYKLKLYLSSIKEKTTILISSHILDTLSDICDKFILIEKGKVKKTIINDKDIKNLESEIFDKSI